MSGKECPPTRSTEATDHSTLRLKTLRGGVFTVLSQGAKLLIQLGSTLALARLLDPKDFGVVGMVTAITGILFLFRDLGLATVTVQRPDLTDIQISSMFWVNFALGSVFALIILAASPLLGMFFQVVLVVPIARSLAPAFLLGGLAVQPLALLRRDMQFHTLAIIEVLSMLGGVLAGVGFAFFKAGPWALVAMQITNSLLACALAWAWCEWRPQCRFSLSEIRPLLTFGAHLSGFELVSYIGRSLDSILIGKFFGPVQLGYYSRATALLVAPMQQLLGPVAAVALPALSRVANDRARFQLELARLLRWVAFIVSPAVAFIIANSTEIVTILLGPEWSQVAPIFSWLGLVAFTQPISSVLVLGFTAAGKGHALVQFSVVNTCLIALSIILAARYGIVAIAASFSITGLLLRTTLLAWFSSYNRLIPATVFAKSVVPSIVAGVVVCCAGSAARLVLPFANSIVGVVVVGTIICLAYLFLQSCLPGGRRTICDMLKLFHQLRSATSSTV